MKTYFKGFRRYFRWMRCRRRMLQVMAIESLIRENERQCRLEYLRNWDNFPDNSSFKIRWAK